MTHVVVAEFQVQPDKVEEFAAFMRRHAELSRAEPGCRAFEVVQSQTDPAQFLFYEVFDDEAAYTVHRAAPHYQRWRDIGTKMLIPQPDGMYVRRYEMRRVSP